MVDLLEAALDVLTCGLHWRGLLCCIGGIIVACILGHYGVSVLWSFDIPVVAVVLGIGIGLWWDARAG